MIQCVKSFFLTQCPNPNPPRPALSEHSTSNPAPAFYSPTFEAEAEAEAEEIGEAGFDSSEPLTRPGVPMQLDDFMIGSPDDSSNHLDSNFHLLAPGTSSDHLAHGGLDAGMPSKDPIITTTLQPQHSISGYVVN